MQRWERDREAPETAQVVLQRVAEGEPLKDVCKSRGWPYALVAQWLHGDEELLARYDAALQMWVDGLAMETIPISDNADPAEVAKAALQVKARQWAAEKLYRARYGQTLKVERSVSVTADAGLVETMGALLGMVQRRPERVVSEVPSVEHEMI